MSGLDRRLLRNAPAARRFVVCSAAIGVATAVLVIVQAGLLADTIARAFLGHAGLAALTPALLALTAVVLARAGLAWLGEVAGNRASAAVLAQLRTRLLEQTFRLGPRHPALPGPGRLATLATSGVDELDGYVSRYLPQLLVAAVVPLVVAVRILTVDWISALLIGLTLPLVPLFMALIGLHTRDRVARQWRALAVLGHHFVDVVAGLDVLTAYGRARRQSRQISEMSQRYRVQTLRSLRVAFLSALVLELLATLSVALVAVAVGLRLVYGRMDLATGLLVIVLAPEVYLPLRAVAARFHDSAAGAAAADELFTVLDAQSTVDSCTAGVPELGSVQLRDVRVDGRSGPVLDGFSLRIEPGEVLGLAGPSGAGKSTLLDLLLGWRTPSAGRVEVAGVDLSTVDNSGWLRRVAWLPQHPRLVAGTIADNLRVAAPHACADQLAAVAATVALDLPLDTPVYERGRGLSTGQQRRVALARALLADRPLLLLDEPTEGVDADTEQAVLDALPAALAGRSAVIVSHRAAVLERCDRVVRLPGRLEPRSQPAPAPARAPLSPTTPLTDSVPIEPEPGGRGELLALLRPYRRRLAVAVLAGAGALGSAVALTATSAWLICAAALHPPVLSLMVAIVAVRAFGLSKGGFRYAERLASHDVALRVLAALRVRLWGSLVRLGPAATARLRTGELLARLTGDVEAQQDVVVRALVPGAAALLVGLGTATALGVLLPTAGLTLAAGLLCAGLLAPAVTVRCARTAARRTAAARGARTAAVTELIEAGPDLVAFGAAERRRQQVATLDAKLTALQRKAATATGLGLALTVLAIGGATVACTALGIQALRAGTLPGTELAVLALTPLATADLVAALPEAARRLATALPAARRLADLDRTPAPVHEPAEPLPVPPGDRLAADRITVRWPGAARDAVRDVDVVVAHPTPLVLTGPSGCGKSTVVAALMRTLDPDAGTVWIDDRPARQINSDDLRTRIAWCGPATHLFDSTLRENLRLARPEATDAELADALEKAGLGAWLAGLPDGLATLVGRHGGAVSGGERQRIGLARVLLADRPILLLDEPTAHLDADTAAVVYADLLRAAAGRAALIVTHRPADLPGLPRLDLTEAAVRRPSAVR